MEHKGTVVIETKRLLLRRFNMDDIEFAFKNWTSDEKVTEFLRWPTHKDITITQRVLEDWIDNYKNENYYQWAIELKEISEPIGSISVVDMDDKTDKVHIGYAIGSNWWNQGITSEAFKGIIPFLFEEIKVQRIESQHDPNNPNSGKVMLKNGLTFEGILRQADWSNKGIVDASMYSLLAEEYFNKNKVNNYPD
ncbi:GNAT family N-acetyltransferase [Peptoniphilus sp. KCTC 25270]|uniref:GNAT family N-acetyltransferase n=1 Tax=Peptoniphilus sp. KCTC 25270 TaxID=2897414 RepID=UPI002106BCBE|nr:GNAT family N-acetyltransferase [Peptoniphilus sp. KCTC 25270]